VTADLASRIVCSYLSSLQLELLARNTPVHPFAMAPKPKKDDQNKQPVHKTENVIMKYRLGERRFSTLPGRGRKPFVHGRLGSRRIP